MAKVYLDDLDGRDTVAESIFTALITRGNYNDHPTAAAAAYNAAEAFLVERERRLKADRDAANNANGDEEGDYD